MPLRAGHHPNILPPGEVVRFNGSRSRHDSGLRKDGHIEREGVHPCGAASAKPIQLQAESCGRAGNQSQAWRMSTQWTMQAVELGEGDMPGTRSNRGVAYDMAPPETLAKEASFFRDKEPEAFPSRGRRNPHSARCTSGYPSFSCPPLCSERGRRASRSRRRPSLVGLATRAGSSFSATRVCSRRQRHRGEDLRRMGHIPSSQEQTRRGCDGDMSLGLVSTITLMTTGASTMAGTLAEQQ